MKRLYTSVLCLLFLASSAYAQLPKQYLFIQISYHGSGPHVAQAVETIEAINIVNAATNVDYQAGRAVTLRPGFEAKIGSTFVAQIKPVQIEGETRLQLTAFPNPFEQSTTIKYYLPADGLVNLWVTDAQGKIVGKLVEAENQAAGQHSLEWKPVSLTNGVYIPILESNEQKAVIRLVKK